MSKSEAKWFIFFHIYYKSLFPGSLDQYCRAVGVNVRTARNWKSRLLKSGLMPDEREFIEAVNEFNEKNKNLSKPSLKALMNELLNRCHYFDFDAITDAQISDAIKVQSGEDVHLEIGVTGAKVGSGDNSVSGDSISGEIVKNVGVKNDKTKKKQKVSRGDTSIIEDGVFEDIKGSDTGSDNSDNACGKTVKKPQKKKRTSKKPTDYKLGRPITERPIPPAERPSNWFRPGNNVAKSHGAYTKYLPPEIQEQVNTFGRDDFRSLESEIRLSKGKLIMTEQKRIEWDEKLKSNTLVDSDFYISGVKRKLSDNKELEKEVTRKRPDFEAQEERLTRRIAWLAQVHDQLSKRSSMTADEGIMLRMEIMERAISEGWSAVEAGYEIEKHGLEVPFTIQQKIKAELSIIEPEMEDNGISDEELEAASIKYSSKVEKEVEAEGDRRDAIEALYEVEAESRVIN